MRQADDIERLVRAEHWNPSVLLGPHPMERNGEWGIVVRAFLPEAVAATLLPDEPAGAPITMTTIHAAGLFEAAWPDAKGTVRYRIRVQDQWGGVTLRHDPYAFPMVLSDLDLHLFAEGRHSRLYEKLGAHRHTLNGVSGVGFAVWAPTALRVSVVGDFNSWDGRRHMMRSRGATGLWELFIPDLPDGSAYKYEIRSRSQDVPFLKADPYAFAAELRPKTASLVRDISQYQWTDQPWMEARRARDPLKCPWTIYEVHLGSWARVPEDHTRWLTYKELAATLIPYVVEMGYTHLELMPVTEHPFDGSWGYQTTGYFAPTSRFGPPEDFMAFVDACHQAGLGVILDWVPAHFPDDPHGLAWFDGSYLYDHEDPKLGFHPEWKSRIFNFDRVEVRNFLLNSALFWLDRYHIDGLRVDAVASMLYLDYARQQGEWIPNRFGGHENLGAVEFLKEFNVLIHQEYPGVVTIAEESTSWPGVSRPTYTGGLGFTFKWNMGWMHDMLDYFSLDPIYRKHHQGRVTFGLLYAFSENFVLALSHDEVVHGKQTLLGKMPGDDWQRFANVRALFGLMYGHPGKKMLFMGGELGPWQEWHHDHSLPWHLLDGASHRGLQRLVRDLNHLCRSEPALYEMDCEWHGFQWIDCSDTDHAVVAFIRRGANPDQSLVCACNFTPVPRMDYRIGVPVARAYRELLNTDAEVYGGSNLGNGGLVSSDPIPWHGQPQSLSLLLPPLSVLFLKPL